MTTTQRTETDQYNIDRALQDVRSNFGYFLSDSIALCWESNDVSIKKLRKLVQVNGDADLQVMIDNQIKLLEKAIEALFENGYENIHINAFDAHDWMEEGNAVIFKREWFFPTEFDLGDDE